MILSYADPKHRPATVWEQVSVMLFLLSPEASNLTGATCAMDGGRTAYWGEGIVEPGVVFDGPPDRPFRSRLRLSKRRRPSGIPPCRGDRPRPGSVYGCPRNLFNARDLGGSAARAI